MSPPPGSLTWLAPPQTSHLVLAFKPGPLPSAALLLGRCAVIMKLIKGRGESLQWAPSICQAPDPPFPCNCINPQDNAIGWTPIPLLQMRKWRLRRRSRLPEVIRARSHAYTLPLLDWRVPRPWPSPPHNAHPELSKSCTRWDQGARWGQMAKPWKGPPHTYPSHPSGDSPGSHCPHWFTLIPGRWRSQRNAARWRWEGAAGAWCNAGGRRGGSGTSAGRCGPWPEERKSFSGLCRCHSPAVTVLPSPAPENHVHWTEGELWFWSPNFFFRKSHSTSESL